MDHGEVEVKIMRLTNKPLFILFSIMLLSGFAMNGDAENLAERLGYPADSVLLIIHADDMGMCHSANVASIDALEKGIVTCGSVMVPCPWFEELTAYARTHPEADIGLHLTLNAEWKSYRWGPVAGRSVVKGLVDPAGYLFHDVREVYGSATPEEVEKEVRAQIEFALASGVKPTHLDSHMGTLYYNPKYLQVAFKLSEEYDIPLMFFNPTPEMIEKAGGRDVFPIEAIKVLQQRGIPLLDGLAEIDDGPLEGMADAYKKKISGLKPGAYEIIIHPTLDSGESRAITNSAQKRDAEYQTFTDPAMKEFLDQQGVKLIGWKNLYPLWKARQR